MELHEFQAKEQLKKFGIEVPFFAVASTLEEASALIEKHSFNQAVVKIQVHAGGRGKAGGVKIGKSPKEIKEHVQALLGMRIVNAQTGPSGIIAKKVLLSELIQIAKEYYFAITIDRARGAVSVIVSPEGGMEIEELASKSPEKLLVETIGDTKKLYRFQLLRLIKFLQIPQGAEQSAMRFIGSCIRAFFELDAELLEINPLVLTEKGQLLALDAKLTIDDNALFRHKDLLLLADPSQISFEELEAKSHDLAYVSLNGNIGCMVNGAGLAMATMDLIRFWGGEPANFLDVGGGASEEKVAAGFSIVMNDPKVKAILVNIFGGIMNCETIASALIQIIKKTKLVHPLVVRMEGTNVESAKAMLAQSKLPIIAANSFDDAAQKVVAYASQNGSVRK